MYMNNKMQVQNKYEIYKCCWVPPYATKYYATKTKFSEKPLFKASFSSTDNLANLTTVNFVILLTNKDSSPAIVTCSQYEISKEFNTGSPLEIEPTPMSVISVQLAMTSSFNFFKFSEM